MRKLLASSSDGFIENTCLENFTVGKASWNLMAFSLTTDVLLDVKDPKKGFDGMNITGACCSFFNHFYFVSGFPYFAHQLQNIISLLKDCTLHWWWEWRTFWKLRLLVSSRPCQGLIVELLKSKCLEEKKICAHGLNIYNLNLTIVHICFFFFFF